MNNTDSQQIVNRFFDAIAILKANKAIRGVNTFTSRYDINRMNLYQLDKDRSRDIFQPAWLTYLVRDFGISAEWLLTGEGDAINKNNDTAQ